MRKRCCCEWSVTWSLDEALFSPAIARTMRAQIEITTICNFRCVYCAGRDMPQEHMPWERFASILERLPPSADVVSLQGEGEPTAHPQFWKMVAAVRATGRHAYTITNASLIDVRRASRLFPEIGVSIDTLDAEEASRIGRYKLERVLQRFEALVELMGTSRVLVHTVAMGQDLQPLRAYLAQLGIKRHVIQPLNSKDDYAYRYPGGAQRIELQRYHHRCQYIEHGLMRYYSIQGQEMPCCFIKDASKFISTEHVATELAARRVPASCTGCRQIFK